VAVRSVSGHSLLLAVTCAVVFDRQRLFFEGHTNPAGQRVRAVHRARRGPAGGALARASRGRRQPYLCRRLGHDVGPDADRGPGYLRTASVDSEAEQVAERPRMYPSRQPPKMRPPLGEGRELLRSIAQPLGKRRLSFLRGRREARLRVFRNLAKGWNEQEQRT